MPLAGKFFGSYEHSLDAKGRVILPAKLRVHFHEPGFLTPHLEQCLALWTVDEFDKEVELQRALAEGDAVKRNAVRDWSAAVFEAEIDRQGRMAIPAHLRSYASLDQEVLVVGMINRVELWSPRLWSEKDAHAGAPGASGSPTS
ncbi:MAG TPA: hypothetical protein VMV02_05965 [Acidimicrobiales bacterium]|nr:hypothetical protein [Acidimicrobiales bacterium]